MAIQMPVTRGKFSLPMLSAVVVGSMIGGAIFALPHSFARVTGPVGALLAWTITGAGMFTLARVLQVLAVRKPDLDGGIYVYAKAGFGDYVGFLAVFGYWLAGCIGSSIYWLLVKSTLGRFFPAFGDGSTLLAILVASIGIWTFHYTVLRGVRQAGVLNTITTIAKVIPIAAFIIILLVAFDIDTFRANIENGVEGVSLLGQVRAIMLVTLYAFLGIEGASIYSNYARRRADVGRATMLGLASVTCLMVLVTLLPYGVLDRSVLASLRQPSMASILEIVVGHWGAILISIALIVSVIGAYLAWTLICAQVLVLAARRGDMPKIFARENSRNSPAVALWVTSAVVQLMVVTTYWSTEPYHMLLRFTSEMSLIPYVLVALFGVLTVWKDDAYKQRPLARKRDLIFALCACLFSAVLIVAGGVRVILVTAIFYSIGTGLYIWARREQKLRVFKTWEWALFGVMAACALLAVRNLLSGDVPATEIPTR